ncbi:MAG: histidinol-phosphatase HisJ family protein [Lachnospiraceae bacterium]
MLWDTHMHTRYSGDSDARPEDMINAAMNLGLDGICITDHMDYDYPNDAELFLFDVGMQQEELSALKEKYKDRFLVLLGIELGLQPQVAEQNRQLLASYDFDFVIGSSHVVHGFDPYYKEYYEGKTEHEAYLEYFESILENISVFEDFDVYGHIDYVVRYGPNKNVDYSYQKYADVIDEIFIQLIQKGKGIELNTAGLKYGLGHPHPTEAALKRYRELGGEILTLGSDGHKPEHIAYDFKKVPKILSDAGFRYYTVFENRKPIMKKL